VTLVLSAITEHEVVQVSDRRFTYTGPDGLVRSRNDEKNKSVLFCGRLMFGFAGRGDLGSKRRSDLWLAQAICEAVESDGPTDQGQILRAIAEKCTALFRRAYRGERHAFVGAGWAHFVESESDPSPVSQADYRPYLATISNFHDGEGKELPDVNDEFGIWLRPLLPGEGGFVWAVPHHLSQAELALLTKRLASADSARSPLMIAEYLAGQIKTVATRDPGVGEGLMISVLPRASLGLVPGIMALAGPPDSESQSFLYVPPSGDTTIQLGPVTTCGGGVTSGFEAKPIPEDFELPTRPATLPEDPPGLVRRWYLAPIIGSGTEADPYMVETLGQGGSGPIESGADGRPCHERTVVLISSSDHSQLLADPRIQAICDLSDLDSEVGDVGQEKFGWIEAASAAHGVRDIGVVRDVLRQIGERYQENFDEANFWVS
jgi:hypothetical protein